MKDPSTIHAAGAVVWRDGAGGVEVLLIHRPKYDDWSFPKGKLDPGEHAVTAAAREVAEETGLDVRLGPALGSSFYDVVAGRKQVRYWAATPVGDVDRMAFRPNDEVDDVVWLPPGEADVRLTRPADQQTLEQFTRSAYRTTPLLVLRHGHALDRDSWHQEDIARPLAPAGKQQALALVPMLQAYGVQRVLSSDAVRCTETVQPFAGAAAAAIESDHRWSEEGVEVDGMGRRVRLLVGDVTATVVCTHRPVLPVVLGLLGVDDPGLEPGEFVVAHHDGVRVRATEQHAS